MTCSCRMPQQQTAGLGREHKENRVSKCNYRLSYGLARITMILAEFSQGTVLHALEIVPYSNVKYLS